MNLREKLLVKIIHRLSEKFKDRLVLKGGMLLRLLNSNRSTQDVDYVFLSKVSKKILVVELREALAEIEEITLLDTRLNSRGIFFDLISKEEPDQKLQVEISVKPTLHLPPEPLATTVLANQYALMGRVISTMALPEAFAHKIAATLEREVMRDLYDLSILEPLCHFDHETLQERLQSLTIRRQKPRKVDWQEASVLLQSRSDDLSAERVKKELFPLLPPHQQQGILPIIKASVERVISRMAAQV